MPCPALLLDELKSVKKLNLNHKEFIKLVKNEKYNKALLFGCKNCDPNDEVQLNLIQILLKYRQKIELNVNFQYGGFTPLLQALNKNHYGLFEILHKAGAVAHTRLSDGKTILAHYVENLVYQYRNPEQYRDVSSLLQSFKELPPKNKFKNDEENARFDTERLNFIKKTLDYLKKYVVVVSENDLDSLSITLSSAVSDYQMQLISAHVPSLVRSHLIRICTTVQNFSYKLRDRYVHLLGPSPFTWYTFERLGGLFQSQYSKRIVEFSTNGGKNGFSESFLNEVVNAEHLCNEAIVSIIKFDVPVLSQFFAEIQQEHTAVALPALPVKVLPIQLIATRALLNRVGDNVTLLNLNRLTSNFRRVKPHDESNRVLSVGAVIAPCLEKNSVEYTGGINLNTKVGRHAALNIVVAIGELCGGKNLSKDIRKLDKSINWQALVLLRDLLSHPEERDNYRKIQALLINDSDLLHNIIYDIRDLHSKVISLTQLRAEKTGAYEWNTKRYWHTILKEFRRQLTVENAEDMGHKEPSSRRVSEEDEEFFIKAFKPDTPIEILLECRALFNGSKELPEKSFISRTKCHLILRQDNPEQFKRCTKIIDSAFSNPNPTSKEERIQIMAEQDEERRKVNEALYSGLNAIRSIVHVTSTMQKIEYYLTPLQHIDAALESIANIKEFLTDCKYLDNKKAFCSAEEWDHYNQRRKLPSIAELLYKNSELNEAIELNVRFVLRFLSVIHKYHEAHLSNLLTEDYSLIRAITNYLAHGDSLNDPFGFDYTKFSTPTEHRQRHTLPLLFRIIFELSPELERIAEAIKAKKSAVPQVLSHGIFSHVSDRIENDVSLLFCTVPR